MQLKAEAHFPVRKDPSAAGLAFHREPGKNQRRSSQPRTGSEARQNLRLVNWTPWIMTWEQPKPPRSTGKMSLPNWSSPHHRDRGKPSHFLLQLCPCEKFLFFLQSREPHWTYLSSAFRIFDYILVAPGHVEVLGVLQEPDDMHLVTPVAHCSLWFASDHVLQAARLVLKPSA